MDKIQKIDFILPVTERHSWIAFLTRELAKAFEKLNIETRLLIPPQDRDPKKFLNDLYAHAPDCTICFNGILPDNQGNFLADLIRVPHLAILTESPNGFLELGKSPYTAILCPDQQHLDILNHGGCEKTLFFPFAAPIDMEPVVPLHERRGSILIAPTWVDGEAIRSEWKNNLPSRMIDFLEEVIFRTLSEPDLSYYHAYQVVMAEKNEADQKAFQPWTTFSLFTQIEAVLRERDTTELLKAFEGMEVDLIVQRGLKEEWVKRLGTVASNCRFHEGIPHEIFKNFIRQAKIFLSSSPQFKFGTTGDLFTSLLFGAYSFHSQCPYLEWGFKEGHGAFFYPYLAHAEIREKASNILSNPKEFQEEVEKGRRLVIEGNTWIERAELLAQWLPTFLKELPNGAKLTHNNS